MTKVRSIAVAVVWARAAAGQTAQVSTESGMHRAVFRVPAGAIRLNMPGDLTAGDHVVGTVYTEPAGRDRKEQDKNAQLLTSYSFDLSGGISFDGNRMNWSVPANLTPAVNQIRLRDKSKKIVTQCELPILPRPAGTAPGSPPSIDLPLGGAAGGFVSVWGTIPDNVTASAVVGGKPADLIAQSPRKAVFLTQPDVTGATTIEVTAGPVSAKGPFTALALAMKATTRDLRRGQSDTITAVVSGLAGLTVPAELMIQNVTPAIAQMEGGGEQRVVIRPADVRPDGTFLMQRRLLALQDGVFDIAGAVTRPPVSQLPAAALVGRAISRWSRTSGATVTDDARAAIVRGVQEAQSVLDDFFLREMSYHVEPGDVLQSLVEEYLYDLRNRLLNPAFGAVRPPAMPRFALGFQAPQSPVVVIDAAAVQKRTFLQFLGDVMGRLAPSGGWGAILVTSQPPLQPFTIDSKGGITIQTFSATVGLHTVNVGSCRKQVQVPANQTVPVNCP